MIALPDNGFLALNHSGSRGTDLPTNRSGDEETGPTRMVAEAVRPS